MTVPAEGAEDMIQYTIACSAAADQTLYVPRRAASGDQCSHPSSQEATSSSGTSTPSAPSSSAFFHWGSSREGNTDKKPSRLAAAGSFALQTIEAARALTTVGSPPSSPTPGSARALGKASKRSRASSARHGAVRAYPSTLTPQAIQDSVDHASKLSALLANTEHGSRMLTEAEQLEREHMLGQCRDEHLFVLLTNGSFCKLSIGEGSGVDWCIDYGSLIITQPQGEVSISAKHKRVVCAICV